MGRWRFRRKTAAYEIEINSGLYKGAKRYAGNQHSDVETGTLKRSNADMGSTHHSGASPHQFGYSVKRQRYLTAIFHALKMEPRKKKRVTGP
jgi:hypothetical protein